MWFFFEGRPKPCKGWRDGRKLNLISLSWVPKPSSHCDYFTGQTMLVEPLNISRLGTPFAQLFPERQSCIWTLCRLQSFFVFFIWLLFSVDCLLFFFFFSSSPLSPAITGCARLTAHPEFVFFSLHHYHQSLAHGKSSQKLMDKSTVKLPAFWFLY